MANGETPKASLRGRLWNWLVPKPRPDDPPEWDG